MDTHQLTLDDLNYKEDKQAEQKTKLIYLNPTQVDSAMNINAHPTAKGRNQLVDFFVITPM